MIWFYIDRLSLEMSPRPHKIKWVNNALNINVISFLQERFSKEAHTAAFYTYKDETMRASIFLFQITSSIFLGMALDVSPYSQYTCCFKESVFFQTYL